VKGRVRLLDFAARISIQGRMALRFLTAPDCGKPECEKQVSEG